MTATRAGIAGTLAALVIAAGCVRLGIWQLDRLEQRRSRNTVIETRLAAPVTPARTAFGDTVAAEYTRVSVAGAPDEARSMVIAARYRRGAPGVHVMTPVHLAGGGVIMLDRGWVPAPDAATIDLARVPPLQADTVIGLVRRFAEADPVRPSVDTLPARRQRVLYRVSQEAVEALLPYAVLPLYVQALPGGGSGEIPIPADPPELTQGPHLGYAIQWFSFAAIAIIGWAVLVWRSGGRRAGPERTAADVS